MAGQRHDQRRPHGIGNGINGHYPAGLRRTELQPLGQGVEHANHNKRAHADTEVARRQQADEPSLRSGDSPLRHYQAPTVLL